MHRFIDGEDRLQQALLPYSLEDYVDEENPVRVIEVFIDELDLTALGFSGMSARGNGPTGLPSSTLLCRDEAGLHLLLLWPTLPRTYSHGGAPFMTLADTLQGLREASTKRIPPESAAIMHRATEELRASGITDRVSKVGDPLPAFALPNSYGQAVRSADLSANGPLVLTFFRGSW
jgi:hypothetical protein